MEPDKQVEKRRARQDEYWRQRTLARQIQMQRRAQTDGELQDGEQALEEMDSRHRMGKLLNFFMDAYNDLKPAEPFFHWIESMTQIDQLKILQKIMKDRGYGGIVKPEWIRAFKRGCRCMHASCDCFVEAIVQGESARGEFVIS
ncbi:hypothetical protein IMCC3135_30015 [Granulosicoccus antarcticus IMCC3135]|uniref:Uncharacterized protein n=2 Tax=Granulosicoccus TaxID=437504 RepID=A0A2Z2NX82_9GAMM|nr:hypothetical protein IMCC3135_30015 [Granulosicoccus antarcticus IMCC3135]